MNRRRNIVVRPDGRPVNVARSRGHLFVCASGCCCGRTEDGFAPVPAETFHFEWERRRLRNVVHLTIGGCLGPCALANVALLLFDGQAQWFHSVNSEARALDIYDHVEAMLDADGCLPPPLPLEVKGLRGDGGEPVLGAPAAAAARAHEEMAARARHVDRPPVGTDHDVATPLVGHGAGGATSATPIRASRVTRGTRSVSPSRSVPAGRCGSTM